MTPLIELLATFKPPDKLLAFLNDFVARQRAAGKDVSPEAIRWLSVWPHWDAWLIELEKRATEEDEKLLAELIRILPTQVNVTELN